MTTYSFEMESELYISDDAPIILSVGVNEATGSVILCEGFQILLVVDKDLGEIIGQAFVSVEPWKLLEALVEKLDSISPDDKTALKLIQEGPGLATANSATAIPKGQEAAIRAAKNNDITVIWGPPGTGKTYTMAQIAVEALQNEKTVLIVSHSNISVDGVVKQTVSGLKDAGMNNLLMEGRVLRYGYVRDEALSLDSFAVAYNYALNHRKDLQIRLEQLRKEKEILQQTGNKYSPKRDSVEKELKKIRAEIREEERAYVERARLVATTISKVTVDSLFDEHRYDIVMFDEVSMAYVPQIILAAMYAKEKLILVGDFRQLAPIVQSEAKKILGADIFSYLGIASATKVCAHPWLVMLNEQRRMHPAISAFPNKYVYHNLLVDHKSVKTNRMEIVKRDPLSGYAINLVNLSGTYAAAMKNSDNSRFNILSALVAFSTALQAEESGEKSVGIITPYAAQTRLIRAMIQDYRKTRNTSVVCSTVHQFQGSERNLIIFDAVESYPASKVGWLMGKIMDSVTRLINVAVTRARGKLIVIANLKFWEMRFAGSQHPFWKLIEYLSISGNMIGVKEKNLKSYIQELPSTRYFGYYGFYEDIISDFSLDVGRSQEKIVISIPDGELDEEMQGQLFHIIMKAASKRVRILCKTNGYENLPNDWKSIAWASDNAIFPLIIIDDKVAWYGIPKSKGKFVDGDRSFVTVCQTVFRIVGDYTLEMIKTFSDFEYREVNKQRTPLVEKTNENVLWSEKQIVNFNKNDNGIESHGLDNFIRQTQKCPKCKNSMSLARGKSGKCYQKCTSMSCKEIAYLTPEVVNWYITREQVVCPIHHCGLRAGLGKYGIYVKCDQGHYLKPDEI